MFCQVLPIWEGTSSVMSLDVFRAINKSNGEAITAFHARVKSMLDKSSTAPGFSNTSSTISKSLSNILSTMKTSPDTIQLMARDFCLSLAHTYIAALLLEHAMVTNCPVDLMVVEKWCQRDLCPVARYGMERYSKNMGNKEKELVFQLYDKDATFPADSVR